MLSSALAGCIEGHESLHRAGLLHRDISMNNLIINEDPSNPSWPAFLIDLDLAVWEQRDGASGAEGRMGTRAFMAIGALDGEQHSFMHDLESFFWVLFWICIHCDGPGKRKVVKEFDGWNYMDTKMLATQNMGEVAHEHKFINNAKDTFTKYWQPLVPWVNRLRRMVFPGGLQWETEDASLYRRMRELLAEAGKDPEVVG